MGAGGGGGIRTHEPREGLLAFQASPFGHSGTPPLAEGEGFEPPNLLRGLTLSRRAHSSTLPPFLRWYARQDSNLRPPAPQADALSAKLRAHILSRNSLNYNLTRKEAYSKGNRRDTFADIFSIKSSLTFLRKGKCPLKRSDISLLSAPPKSI